MFYVYIAYNNENLLHSIGVTTNLRGRFKILTHLDRKKKNGCKLVYYETFENSIAATKREDKLNIFSKNQIHELVQSVNPLFVDLRTEND